MGVLKNKPQVVRTRESRECDERRTDGKPAVLAPRQFAFYRHMRGQEYTLCRARPGCAGLSEWRERRTGTTEVLGFIF
jgi:hypothetical protein